MNQVHANESGEERVHLQQFQMQSIVLEKQPGQSAIVDPFVSRCVQLSGTTYNAPELFGQDFHYRYKQHIGRAQGANKEEQKEGGMYSMEGLHEEVKPDCDLLESTDE